MLGNTNVGIGRSEPGRGAKRHMDKHREREKFQPASEKTGKPPADTIVIGRCWGNIIAACVLMGPFLVYLCATVNPARPGGDIGCILFCVACMLYMIYIGSFWFELNGEGMARHGLLGTRFYAWPDFQDVYIVKVRIQRVMEVYDMETIVFATVSRRRRRNPATGGYLTRINQYVSFGLDSLQYPVQPVERYLGRNTDRDELLALLKRRQIRIDYLDRTR